MTAEKGVISFGIFKVASVVDDTEFPTRSHSKTKTGNKTQALTIPKINATLFLRPSSIGIVSDSIGTKSISTNRSDTSLPDNPEANCGTWITFFEVIEDGSKRTVHFRVVGSLNNPSPSASTYASDSDS